jgi:hypothetical protein
MRPDSVSIAPLPEGVTIAPYPSTLRESQASAIAAGGGASFIGHIGANNNRLHFRQMQASFDQKKGNAFTETCATVFMVMGADGRSSARAAG